MPPKSPNAQQKGKQPKGSSAGPSASKSIPASKAGPTWIAPKAITHPEHHHTLNHLDHVASYYAAVAASSSPSSSNARSSDAACRLQAEVVRSAKTLSRKAVIRLDTGVKRASCATCDTSLIHGLTASVRIRVSGPHGHVVKSRCAVCGAISRRPAPNLIPELQSKETSQRAREGNQEGEDDVNTAGPDTKNGSNKVSQRQRRRTASIKRQLLRPSDGAQKLPTTTRSRRQKSEQRHARIAKRATAPSSDAVPPSTENAALGLQATASDLPSSALPESTASPPTFLHNLASSPVQTKRRRRTPHPNLSHFNDRVQGSHWDDVFTTLDPRKAQDDPKLASATQALDYWQKAARSRGDHLVLSGVGKNGALGPQLP